MNILLLMKKNDFKEINTEQEQDLFSIPDDVNIFIQQLKKENTFLIEENTSIKKENLSLKEENNRLRRELYGSKSERHSNEKSAEEDNESQQFNEAEKGDDDEKKQEAKKPKKNRKHTPTGKKALPEDLPKDTKEHHPCAAPHVCPLDGTPLELMGVETSQKVDYVPAQIKIVEHRYYKYKCSCCQSIHKSTAEPSVLPGAQCEAGLLAHVAIQKYLYSLPLYRQAEMLQQIGIDFSRQTLARWMVATANFLQPLAQALKTHIVSQDLVHADETTVQVLKENGKPATSQSYMWGMCTGEREAPLVYFEYHSDRSQASADHLLQGFQGYLITDAYGGYNKIIAKEGVTWGACWAHCRRKFEASLVLGSKKGSSKAEYFIEKIKELFLLERKWASHSLEERLKQRQLQSKPITEELQSRMLTDIDAVTPKSQLGTALQYMQNQWKGLTQFLTHPELPLSNNRMENFIRPFAVGRRNWLFADTPAGAHASSVLYSLAISARANGKDVFIYFRTLLAELPALLRDNPQADLTAYLPHLWQPPPQQGPPDDT